MPETKRIRTIDDLARHNPNIVNNGAYKYRVGWRPEGSQRYRVDENVTVFPRRDGAINQGDHVGHTIGQDGTQVTIPGNQTVQIEPTHTPDRPVRR